MQAEKARLLSAYADAKMDRAYVGEPEAGWIINCFTLRRVDIKKELEKFLNDTSRQFEYRRTDGQS